MKIELLVDHYANAQGLKLTGAGIHEVEEGTGQYLLATFPDWFVAVAGEPTAAPEPMAEAVEEPIEAVEVIEAAPIAEVEEKKPKKGKK